MITKKYTSTSPLSCLGPDHFALILLINCPRFGSTIGVLAPHVRVSKPQSMKTRFAVIVSSLLLFTTSFAYARQVDSTKVASQNPSPMIESTRKHERLEEREYPGVAFEIRDVLTKPVQVFVSIRSAKSKTFDLLIHFHGAAYISEYAAARYRGNVIAATVSIGSGSKVYNDAFQDTTKFISLVDSILAETKTHLNHTFNLRRVILSGFSAGYGAIRKIISTEANYDRVDAVLLLDGFHTSYLPERRVLAEGGRVDSTGLLPYVKLAQDATTRKSHKRFLITHSEIFPGTFVSTTEATDYLLNALSIKRIPVLKWGPLGMQQLSYGRKNHLEVLGFAGNTARDHVDHLQGLYWFLNRLAGL